MGFWNFVGEMMLLNWLFGKKKSRGSSLADQEIHREKFCDVQPDSSDPIDIRQSSAGKREPWRTDVSDPDDLDELEKFWYDLDDLDRLDKMNSFDDCDNYRDYISEHDDCVAHDDFFDFDDD